MGNAGPKVARVKADVEGDGDVAPETVTDDVRGVLKVFRAAEGAEEGWLHGAEFSQEATRRFVRDVLRRDMERDLVGSEDDGASRSDGGEESADEEQADLLQGRILAVLAALEDRGELEKVCGESAAEQSDVR